MEEYYTVTQAAVELGIPRETVRKRLQRGLMQGEHLTARLWVIPRAEVDRWRDTGRLKRGRPRKQATAEQLRRDMAEHQAALDEGRQRIRSGADGAEGEDTKE